MSEAVLEKQATSETTLATVAVVGLGYVGLPVAVEFGKRRPTIGYDLSKRRVENLQHKVDATGEVPAAELIAA
ncbi:MAG: GDP-mannose dehydrogenase, partial [Burkholderiales bacterium]|nr:GDP-mannose dehydrogenase [Burkholderiales bacterium]